MVALRQCGEQHPQKEKWGWGALRLRSLEESQKCPQGQTDAQAAGLRVCVLGGWAPGLSRLHTGEVNKQGWGRETLL